MPPSAGRGVLGYRVRQQRSPWGVHQALILPTVSRHVDIVDIVDIVDRYR